MIAWVHEHFKRLGLSLSMAESCTGGLISHLLTDLPGASLFLDSSLVCYSVESKRALLKVKKSVVSRHGAISEKAAEEMARGVRRLRGTDFSLAVTGNLGPVPMEDKQIGLVYMAVDWERETISKGMLFEGSREEIKYQAALEALHFLKEVAEVWT